LNDPFKSLTSPVSTTSPRAARLPLTRSLSGQRLVGVGPRLFINPASVERLKAEREAEKAKKKGTDPQ
jgi:hypothetical protein